MLKTYTPEDLKLILQKHSDWSLGEETGSRAYLSGAYLSGADLFGAYLSGAYLSGANLSRAYLSGANLSGANLSGANLFGANLSGANLSGANLSGANLSGAYLSGANLSGADLSGANLFGAYLSGAYLSGANLSGANLSGAYLSGANLSGADLKGCILPEFRITPEEGAFIGWKKVREGLLKLQILEDSPRCNSTISRKCRARAVKVLQFVPDTDAVKDFTEFTSKHDETFKYRLGKTVAAPDYSDDIRQECVGGIHFFMTRKEAEAYS